MKIIKSIAAIVLVLLVIKVVMFIVLNYKTLIAIALVLGSWMAIFLFFDIVSGGMEERHYEKHKYDDFFEARDRWERRHRR